MMHLFANAVVASVLPLTEQRHRFPRTFLKCLRAVVLGLGAIVSAQDIIVKQDKTQIKAVVVKITSDESKYKRFDFQQGPLYGIAKAEVARIVYQQG